MDKTIMTLNRKTRVQFDFTDTAIRQLDELVAEAGAASRAEVVRRALALFKDALDIEKDGGVVLFKTQHGDIEEIRVDAPPEPVESHVSNRSGLAYLKGLLFLFIGQ